MTSMALPGRQVPVVRTLEETASGSDDDLRASDQASIRERQIFPNSALLKAGLLNVADGITATDAYVFRRVAARVDDARIPLRDPPERTVACRPCRGRQDDEPADDAQYGLPRRPRTHMATLSAAKEGCSSRPRLATKGGDAIEGSLGAHGYV